MIHSQGEKCQREGAILTKNYELFKGKIKEEPTELQICKKYFLYSLFTLFFFPVHRLREEEKKEK